MKLKIISVTIVTAATLLSAACNRNTDASTSASKQVATSATAAEKPVNIREL